MQRPTILIPTDADIKFSNREVSTRLNTHFLMPPVGSIKYSLSYTSAMAF
jgi:hypothetical protein